MLYVIYDEYDRQLETYDIVCEKFGGSTDDDSLSAASACAGQHPGAIVIKGIRCEVIEKHTEIIIPAPLKG